MALISPSASLPGASQSLCDFVNIDVIHSSPLQTCAETSWKSSGWLPMRSTSWLALSKEISPVCRKFMQDVITLPVLHPLILFLLPHLHHSSPCCAALAGTAAHRGHVALRPPWIQVTSKKEVYSKQPAPSMYVDLGKHPPTVLSCQSSVSHRLHTGWLQLQNAPFFLSRKCIVHKGYLFWVWGYQLQKDTRLLGSDGERHTQHLSLLATKLHAHWR